MHKISKYWVILPLALFALIQSQYVDFIPLWDGKWYWEMIQQAAEQPFSIKNYAVSGHPTIAYALLVSLTQSNILYFHLLQILIGFIGIFSFYKLLEQIFADKYQIERLLLTTVFAISPAFIANSLEPTLDFPVTCFVLAFMSAFLAKRYILFLIFLVCAVFTRETALGFYLSFAVAYIVLFITRPHQNWRKHYQDLSFLFAPVLIMLAFMIYKDVDLKSGFLWGAGLGHIIGEMFFRYDLTHPHTITHLLHIFFINFNWVLSIFILLHLGGQALTKLRSFIFNKKYTYVHPLLKINKSVFYTLLFVFITNSIVLVNYITYTNIRYRLPVIALFFILAFYSFLVILQDAPKIRRGILTVLIGAMFVQNFSTIDFASRGAMKMFSFGNHDLLCMTSWVTEHPACGRDQRRYNLQYTEQIYTINVALQQMDLSAPVNIIADDRENFFLFSNINTATRKMTVQAENEQIIKPVLYSFTDSGPYSKTIDFSRLKDHELPAKIYYFLFPMGADKSNVLQNRGYQTQAQEIWHQGYKIDLITAER